jgi:hypothetical protein
VRVRVLAAAVIAALGLAACSPSAPANWVAPSSTGSPTPIPTPTQTPTPPPTTTPPPGPTLKAPANPDSIKVAGTVLFGWALLDRRTGAITGSSNSATTRSTVESMIKPWIASDYLRTLAAQGKTPSEQVLNEITLMIVDSNDPMAEKYYQLGGADAVIERLEKICDLPEIKMLTDKWSFTQMSPQEAVRYGQCIADGRAAGPLWTNWILDTMRHIRGGVGEGDNRYVEGGRWGFIDGLPPELGAQLSFKNGWTMYKNGWHIECLGILPDWVLNVTMVRTGDLQLAANACASVAKALVVPAP